MNPDARALIDALRPLRRVVVAFSGGVDSSVVAAAAARADLEALVAVTAQSPSVSHWQLDMATKVAGEIGIKHRIIQTEETKRPEYIQNDGRRCFFCKQTLYRTLQSVVGQSGDYQTVSGTNADDLGDYRPGIEAGKLAGIQTPLADQGLGKSQVRAIAQQFGLSNADTPAAPCLASRIAYGVQVTPERLARIEKAENWLRARGFTDCRVRTQPGELARVEVPTAEIIRFDKEDLLPEMIREYTAWGFQSVSVDAQGLRSGNLNEMLITIGEADNG